LHNDFPLQNNNDKNLELKVFLSFLDSFGRKIGRKYKSPSSEEINLPKAMKSHPFSSDCQLMTQ